MEKLREKLYRIVFEAETPSGKLFDVVLIWAVVLSLLAVMAESVEALRKDYYTLFLSLEWGFTILFTIEYVLRVLIIKKPLKYIFSFFGLVDLFAIVPTYLSLMLPGAQSLLAIRTLRLLRVFRVLKLSRYTQASKQLSLALVQSRHKIAVFLWVVLSLAVLFGSLMYLIEGRVNGFTSIPKSIYWAIVTMTTVGYGDLAPQTPLGQFVATFLMICGYGVIAVPTGIVTAELVSGDKNRAYTRVCQYCAHEGHSSDSKFCDQCGQAL